jgi:elongation factor Ts
MVNALQVKQLREQTGAGMMDCKKALAECSGDIAQAADWLRKKGIAAAAKKGSRVAAEGLIALQVDTQNACIVEINSETDFVAKNESFKELASSVLDSITGSSTDNVAELVINGKSCQEAITNSISVIGENIQLRRFARVTQESGFIASYLHNSVSDYLGRIGVLISINCDKITDEARLLGKQIAMHIAASKPVAAKAEDVPADLVAKEREIFIDQAKSSGKPAEIIEKMVEGRVRKYYQEVVLVEQPFVIDGKTPIKDIISNFEKSHNCKFTIDNFVCYEVGEGIEKAADDFASEVQSIASSS